MFYADNKDVHFCKNGKGGLLLCMSGLSVTLTVSCIINEEFKSVEGDSWEMGF